MITSRKWFQRMTLSMPKCKGLQHDQQWSFCGHRTADKGKCPLMSKCQRRLFTVIANCQHCICVSVSICLYWLLRFQNSLGSSRAFQRMLPFRNLHFTSEVGDNVTLVSCGFAENSDERVLSVSSMAGKDTDEGRHQHTTQKMRHLVSSKELFFCQTL